MKKYLLQFIIGLGLLFYSSHYVRADWVQTNAPSGGYITALAVSESNIFAGTDNSGVYLSTNNGTTWTAINSGLTNTNVNCLAVSGSNIFAGTNGGWVFLSTNNGTSWTNSAPPLAGGVGGDVTSLAPNGNYLLASNINLYIGVGGGDYVGYAYLSSNNGKSWTNVFSKGPAKSITFAASGSKFYAITLPWNNVYDPPDTSSGFLYSINNGNTWTDVSSSLHVCLASLYVNDSNIFAGTIAHGILLSTNNGSSWTPINSGLPDSTSVYSFAMNGSVIFAGTSKGVFSSGNDGMSWTAFNTGLPFKIGSLAVSGNTIFAGTDSNGIWRRPLSEMVGTTNAEPRQRLQKQENICIHSLSNTGPNVTIKFSLPHSNQVTARVYDLSGHEMASLVDKQLGSGLHSVTWDTRNRAPGCYAVRMRVGSNT